MNNFLRLKDVVKKTSISRSTVLLWVRENKFPKPIKVSPKVTIWKESEIDEWIKEKVII